MSRSHHIIGAVPEKASVAGAVTPQPVAVPVALSVKVGTLFIMAQATLPEVKVATTEPQLGETIAGQEKVVDYEQASAAPVAVTEFPLPQGVESCALLPATERTTCPFSEEVAAEVPVPNGHECVSHPGAGHARVQSG
ncbi:MAG: hypothetical protein ACLPJH_15270 [Myxococcaceae bacterium]